MALQFESDKILANKHSRRGEVARRALREMAETRRLGPASTQGDSLRERECAQETDGVVRRDSSLALTC